VSKPSAVTIGTGNLASHFIPAFTKSSHVNIKQCLGRIPPEEFHNSYGTNINYSSNLSQIEKQVDFLFLMVNDGALAAITKELSSLISTKTCVVHFSGASSLALIDEYFTSTACLWPVSSISSKDQSLDLSMVPVCLNSTSMTHGQVLAEMSKDIFQEVYEVSEEEKSLLHLGAVVVNNFTNHLYHQTAKILEDKGLDFDILKPIIMQTASKILKNAPSKMQTGPAIRGDQETLLKHHHLLANRPELLTIYQQLSESIINNS